MTLFEQGFDALLVDYLHPRKFPIIGPIAAWVLRFATVGVLIGVYQFETNDIGSSPFPPPLPSDCETDPLPRLLFSFSSFTPFLLVAPLAGLTELIKKAWKGPQKAEE
jgi:hypothetical protein